MRHPRLALGRGHEGGQTPSHPHADARVQRGGAAGRWRGLLGAPRGEPAGARAAGSGPEKDRLRDVPGASAAHGRALARLPRQVGRRAPGHRGGGPAARPRPAEDP
eukprot:15278551-Heterocapsa_arctica.AAC.1